MAVSRTNFFRRFFRMSFGLQRVVLGTWSRDGHVLPPSWECASIRLTITGPSYEKRLTRSGEDTRNICECKITKKSHMCKFLWDFFERLAVGFLLPAEVVTHSDSGFKRRGLACKRHMVGQLAHNIPSIGDELTEPHFDRQDHVHVV